MMEERSVSVEAMIRGYHIYRSVWEAAVGELKCAREIGNPSDPYTVAVMRATTAGDDVCCHCHAQNANGKNVAD